MKIALVVAGTIISSCLFAQSNNTISVQSELKDIANFNSARQTGYERFQSYKGNTTGSQFFIDNWAPGSITSRSGTEINGSYQLLYDKVRQLVFAKPANTNDAALLEYAKIQSFTIKADRTYKFVPAAMYDSANTSDYFEVLAEGKNATLLKQIQTTFEKSDRNTPGGVLQGKLNDAYVDHYTYFLYHNGKLEKINLKENNFKKALKDYAGKINDYYTAHYGEATSENYYINLVEAINS